MIYERLYVVQWCYDAQHWQVVCDDTDDRRSVPAAYGTATEAEKRRASMAEQFPEAHYRVVGFTHEPVEPPEDELPKLDPTPCGICGCVIGEGLMLLHTNKCHPDRDRTPGTRHGVYGPRFP